MRRRRERGCEEWYSYLFGWTGARSFEEIVGKQNKTVNIFIKRKFVASTVNGFRNRYLSPVGTVPWPW